MKKLKILLILLSMFILIPFTIVNADSGFDSDYSSSSSSSSSSSRSRRDRNSSSYSYKSSYKPSTEETILTIITVIIFSSLVALIVKKKIKEMNEHYSEVEERCKKEAEENQKRIEQILGDLTIDDVKNMAYEKYKEIQVAWMNFDYDTLEQCCTKELYDRYYSQLEEAKKNNQRNIMKDFELEDIEIENCKEDNSDIVIEVFLYIKCYDYIIDNNSNVIKGKDNIKINYEYEMTFIKRKDELLLDKKSIFEQFYEEETKSPK